MQAMKFHSGDNRATEKLTLVQARKFQSGQSQATEK